MSQDKSGGEDVTGTRGNDPAGTGTHSGPRLVERKTVLRGQSICRPREPKSSRRQRSYRDIYSKDPEVTYVKFEAAARDLICSLMERQDRMNEEIFAKLIDLECHVNDINDVLASGEADR